MSSSVATGVNSSLARINASGQLICALCNSAVKSAKVWTAHISGREHRKNVTSLKAGNQKPAATTNENGTAALKRKPQNVEPDVTDSKKMKSDDGALPTDFFDGPNTSKPSAPSTSSIPQSKPDENTDTKDADSSTAADASDSASKPVGTGLNVPEGFFDDKKTDRKKRGVDERDPLEVEFEKFQKEMKVVQQQSEQMHETEQEEEEVWRAVDQVDAQIEQWRRVNELEIRQEQLAQAQTVEEDDEPDDQAMSDDGQDQELHMDDLDWRTKNL